MLMLPKMPPGLDWEACNRARLARDPAFDGVFFTGVRTTRIYCRPVCPVRPAQSKNVQFYATAAAAERAGFSPVFALPTRDGARQSRLERDGYHRGAGNAADPGGVSR